MRKGEEGSEGLRRVVAVGWEEEKCKSSKPSRSKKITWERI